MWLLACMTAQPDPSGRAPYAVRCSDLGRKTYYVKGPAKPGWESTVPAYDWETLEAALPATPTHEPVIKLSEMSIEQRRAYYQRQREAQARTTATEEGSGELEAKAST